MPSASPAHPPLGHHPPFLVPSASPGHQPLSRYPPCLMRSTLRIRSSYHGTQARRLGSRGVEGHLLQNHTLTRAQASPVRTLGDLVDVVDGHHGVVVRLGEHSQDPEQRLGDLAKPVHDNLALRLQEEDLRRPLELARARPPDAVGHRGLAQRRRRGAPDGLLLRHGNPGADEAFLQGLVALLLQGVPLVAQRLVELLLELMRGHRAAADLGEGLVGHPVAALAVGLALKVELLAWLRRQHGQHVRSDLPRCERELDGRVGVATARAHEDPLRYRVGVGVGVPLR
mmetsp:Transcript_85870/g.243517  ORF Transcript_85870/g.243517 Transcript_85870/m.243517 type:complete len:285 (+) Transcript_85870:301-1155(+)